MFGFNSEKSNLILIKTYLLPIPLNERDIEHTLVKKTNQYIAFKRDDFQLSDITNFFGGPLKFDSSLKAYKT